MQLVFAILVITTICFLIPRFRSDMVALASLMSLFLVGLVSVEEALAGFANSVVIMIAALFVVGEGVFQTGLAEKAGSMVVKHTKGSELRLTILMMLLVAVLSGFMSNTGTVAILLPVIVSLGQKLRIHPGKLLMPLAFTSSMGGTLTLIGTAPNLIASQTLLAYGYAGLNFFSFTAIGVLALAVGMAYLWFVGRKMLDKPVPEADSAGDKVSADLLSVYGIKPYIYGVQIPAGNPVVGKTFKELQWASQYAVTVLEVQSQQAKGPLPISLRTNGRRTAVGADYELHAGDRLTVYGEVEAVQRLVSDAGLRFVDVEQPLLDPTQLAEVILTPQSRLNNRTIKEAHFRDKYDLTILSLKHQYEEPRRPSQGEKLLYGDTMLVHGKWNDIHLLHEEREDVVVLSYIRAPERTHETPFAAAVAGGILVLMVVGLVLDLIPAVMTVMLAAMAMVLTRCVRHVDHGYRSVNWQTIVLIACMLPMATALEKTGGIQFISEGLVETLGAIGPVAVMAGLYAITSLFSQFISNTATAVLLYPVAILTAQQLGINPTPLVMAVAFSASMAFATPVATPPNAMVMAAGRYQFADFLRVGVPLQLLIAMAILALLPRFFPF